MTGGSSSLIDMRELAVIKLVRSEEAFRTGEAVEGALKTVSRRTRKFAEIRSKRAFG